MQTMSVSGDIRPIAAQAEARSNASTLPTERPTWLHALALHHWKQRRFEESEVSWGIQLRPGYCDSSNPAAHHGATQHAFLLGHDTMALCGFRAVNGGFGRKRKVAKLGLPSADHNPRCSRCTKQVIAPAAGVVAPLTW